jgi:hypothetical protein
MWSRNKANLYIQDALANFQHDNTISISPPWQRKRYCDRLIATHLTGFGGGAAAAATTGNDVTSYRFDGVGDFLTCGTSSDWDFDTNDFTIECWFKQDHLGENHCFWGMGDSSTFRAMIMASGHIRVEVDNTEQDTVWSEDTNWHHYAISRASGTVKTYLDGTEHDSFSAATTGDSGGTFAIGSGRGSTVNSVFDGVIDEFRITKGTALYTTAFAAPTGPFNNGGTGLLIHCGETILSGATGSGATFASSDDTGHTITEIDDAIRDTSIYKF